MSQQGCCSSDLLYIFSLKANNVQEEINFSKLKKKKKRQNAKLTGKCRVSSLFHFKNHNHNLCYIHLQTTLALSWETLYNDFTHSKKDHQPHLFVPGQISHGPNRDHPPPFPFPSYPPLTQGSCCILNRTITEIGYLDFSRQSGHILNMEYTGLFVI